MIKRLWYVLAFGWAACNLVGGVNAKSLEIASAPFVVMAVLVFIVRGVPRRATVPYRPYRGNSASRSRPPQVMR